MSNSEPIHIRPVALGDLPTIREIYNYYVHTSTCTFQVEPDTEAERLAWFREHGERHPVIVAECAGQVVGWGSLSQWNKRAAYAQSVEASVYVRSDQHRRGVGKALLEALIAAARTLGHHVLIGGACTEQTGSMALQESLGFERVACFRQVGYKFGRWLDVAYYQIIL